MALKLLITFTATSRRLSGFLVSAVGCSDCCRLFIFFTRILKIFVILLGYTKISCIFVKEITTKTNQNGNFKKKSIS